MSCDTLCVCPETQQFTRQWRQCGTTTVVKHLRGAGGAGAGTDTVIEAAVSDVASTGSTLSATVRTRPRQGTATRYERALGVRGGTIVEVSLAITPEGERRPDPRGRAVRVVQVMLDKAGSGI
jgi:hypothetical protein